MDSKTKRYPRRSSPILKILAALAFIIIAFLLLYPAFAPKPGHSRLFFGQNELKQVVLALHNCLESSKGKHPAAVVRDADGAPLYSWRVALLPFLDERKLFDAFAKNEPWDSAHNKALLRPESFLYHSPFLLSCDPTTDTEATSIVAVIGDGTLWPATGHLSLEKIPDGGAQTILLVALAETGIKWSEPRDLSVEEFLAAVNRTTGPGPHLFRNNNVLFGGAVFLVALADGSVRQFEGLSPKDIEAMLTRAGDEAVVLP